jgi:hypothetical protein
MVSGFPVNDFRIEHRADFKIERERSLILKFDFNREVVGKDCLFRAGNDLAFGYLT